MAVGIPSLPPDSFPTGESPNSRAADAQGIELTEDEITAIHEFFLLLDKWDKQKKAA
jgi:hypothetical protein